MSSHRQIAHIWANRSQTRATGHNMYFEGDTIYSYGRHFPIARHVERNGRHAILFTTRTRSVSTAKHISHTRSAIASDIPVFNVDDVTAPPQTALRAHYEARITEALKKAAKARVYVEFHLGDARRAVNEGNSLATFYGFRWRLAMPADLGMAIAEAKERERKTTARATKARQKREREQAAEIASRVPRWLAGENVSLYGHGDTLMRLRGEDIETSQGAKFPVEHGKRAFRLIAACRDKGEAWQRNGHTIHLGHFQIDRIEPNGDVRAGCHFVRWNEIERIAGLLELSAVAVA